MVWGMLKEKRPTENGWAFVFGGEEEDRTPDLRIANAALSQLSYPPMERKMRIADYRACAHARRVKSALAAPWRTWRMLQFEA